MPLRYICGCIRVVFALKFTLAGLSYHFGRGVSFIKDSGGKEAAEGGAFLAFCKNCSKHF